MQMDHRPCPQCGSHSDQRIISVDGEEFQWCQVCLSVSPCDDPESTSTPPHPEAGANDGKTSSS